jgi:hypothetical protein
MDPRTIGRLGGLTNAARHDMRKVAAHARASSPSSFDYWLKCVDPDGELDLSDREIRARSEMRLYFANLGKRTRRSKQAAKNSSRTSS